MDTFAHFGVGIGIYFAQLVILTFVTFLCGMVMLAAVNEYEHDHYGGSHTFPFSAACDARNVTATVNCPFGETSCLRTYRTCELPYNAAAADIAMCIIFCLAIIFSKFIEAKIEQKLDESVQTAKDYSVEVLDPDATADDPNRWYEYFSQFGQVKYITILRRNNELTDLILKKHNVVRKIQESGRMSSKAKTDGLHRQYEKIEEEINRALKKTYPVCKVFVTFDSEKDQHECLNELEVPDYQAIFDLKSTTANSSYFFGDNVLDVRQPPEPDNILWQNLAVGRMQARARNTQAFLAYVGILAVIWYLVKAVRENIPNLLGLLVGVVDSVLPTVFDYLTDYQNPRSEGSKQTSLQTRLFCARFLLSTIIPYLTADWKEVITPSFIGQILTVQIAACFTAPLMDLTDWYGLFMRHYYSAMVSDTQEEMNSFWVGSYWSIAEKYTGIAKVIFVSLFYALLTPISLLIATVAFIVIFFIDNYLLLRRWKVASMLDSTIASRLRRQAILSICAHMFVTMRFIYSWPMDDVFWNGSAYEVVDKAPPYNFFTMKIQPWMSDGQKHIFYSYKTLLILVCLTTLHILILQPFGQWLFTFLCKSIRIAGVVDSMKFSSVESIRIYYPMLRYQEEQYLCSYAKNVLPRHRPVLIDSNNIMKDDLSVYVPVDLQQKVLSIVQYFGVDPIVQYEEKKVIDVDDLQTLASKTLPKPKSKKVLAMSLQDSMASAWFQVRLVFWRYEDYWYHRWTGRHLKPLVPPPPPMTARGLSTRSSLIVPGGDSDELVRMMSGSEYDVEMYGSHNNSAKSHSFFGRTSRSPTPTKDFRAVVRHLSAEHSKTQQASDSPVGRLVGPRAGAVSPPGAADATPLSPSALAAARAFRSVASPTSSVSPVQSALKKLLVKSRSSSVGSSPGSLSPAGADARGKSFFPAAASSTSPTDAIVAVGADAAAPPSPERKQNESEKENDAKADHHPAVGGLTARERFGVIFEGDNEDDSSARSSPKRAADKSPLPATKKPPAALAQLIAQVAAEAKPAEAAPAVAAASSQPKEQPPTRGGEAASAAVPPSAAAPLVAPSVAPVAAVSLSSLIKPTPEPATAHSARLMELSVSTPVASASPAIAASAVAGSSAFQPPAEASASPFAAPSAARNLSDLLQAAASAAPAATPAEASALSGPKAAASPRLAPSQPAAAPAHHEPHSPPSESLPLLASAALAASSSHSSPSHPRVLQADSPRASGASQLPVAERSPPGATAATAAHDASPRRSDSPNDGEGIALDMDL